MFTLARQRSHTFGLFMILATTLTVTLPPQAFLAPAWATPPEPPKPDPPENPCDDQCPPCAMAPLGLDQKSPAKSANPVIFYNGAVQEKATDLSLPGPLMAWSQTRSYDSRLANASMTHLGRNWLSGNGDLHLVEEVGGNIYLIASASNKRTFIHSGGTYAAPAGSDLTLVVSGSYLVLTHLTTGDIDIFYDFSHGTKSGRRAAHTTREWDAEGKDGIRYDYDAYGRLTSIITAEGQDEAIEFHYTTTSSWQLDWIRVGAGGGYYMEVDYTYGFESGTHSDCGADDDLVQVLVRNKGTDGAWIERYTQYRYFSDGKLKSVLESDAIQRIIDAYSGITTAADILNSADTYTDSSLPQLKTRVSRSFTYYSSNQNTNTTSPNDYETVYGNYAGTSLNVDETGYCASETINGGCASCGGGSAAGLTMEYHYIKGKYFGSYSASDITSNPTADGHINIVCLIVIEDVKSGATLLRRNVYGLSKDGYQLRKATMETTSSTALWCTSDIMRNDQRLRQRRMPSTHVSVNTSGELKTFLNPFDGSSTYGNALDDGLVYVYDYNAAGWETDAWVRKGSGTEYYVSATNYGDGMSEATWEIIAKYEYPTATATRANGITTTYDYTYWDGAFAQKKTITTTRAAVPTTQNGSTVPIATSKYFDQDGRLRWTQDGEGYINYYSYQPYTGELAFTATDVDPETAPSGAIGNDSLWLSWEDDGDGDTSYDSSAIPTRTVSPTALALVTTREFDNQGRLRKSTDPAGKLHYLAYQSNYVVKFPYWDSGSTESLLPIEVSVLNNGGVVTDTLSIIGASSNISTDSSEPTGLSALAQSEATSWTRYYYDPANVQLVKSLNYHLIPSSGDGAHITNYYITAFAYDAFGRRTTTVQTSTSSVDQITRRVFDFLDRPTSTERVALSSGVDTGINSTLGTLSYTGIEEVASTVYDGGGVGDGHVTSARSYYGTGGSDYVETQFKRTYRGHIRGVEKNNGGTAFTPCMVSDIDWLGRTTGSALYTTSITWSSVLTSDGYTDFLSGNSTGRNEWNKSYYDKLNRTYRTERYPATEATNHFENNNFYDRNGQLVATGEKYSAQAEYAYDGAGRQYQQRTIIQLASPIMTYGQYDSNGAFTYVAPLPKQSLTSMSGGDAGVIEVRHSVYGTAASGDAEQVVSQYVAELNHNDTNGMHRETPVDFVLSTVHNWYDAANRLIASADYGSGGSDWTFYAPPSRSGTPPTASSSSVLVTQYAYDAATGRQETVTDPAGIVTKSFYDNLGRRAAVAENWVNATADGTNSGGGTNDEQDRVTKFAYNGLGQQTQITAVNVTSGGTVNQETKYYYEDPYNAALVTHTTYPDSSSTPSSGSDLVKLEYNLDGSLKKKTDQRGTIIEYTYAPNRRPEYEKVTTLGGDTDGHVRAIKREYDNLSRLERITSTQNSDGTGTVRNQVKYTYDTTHGRLTKTEQSHENAVSSSPSVQYAYDDTVSSSIYTNGLRPTKVTYPNGKIIHTTYGSSGSIPDVLGRTNLLEADSSGSPGTDLVQYSYNGINRLVIADYAVPDLKLDLYQGTTGTYAGFDRFGRTVRQEWDKYNTGAGVLDRFDYTYDYAGNRLSRNIPSALYAADDRDQVYGYDGLDRLKAFDEGTQSGSSISGTPVREQDWTLDQLGNWPGFIVKAAGSTTLNQTRYHNAVNEIDGNGGASIAASTGTNWADPVYDTAGNMTTMPRPAALTSTYPLKYDAWNRLVEVKADAMTVVATYEYDGLGQRIQKVASDTYDYYYNENWQLLEERKNADTDPLNQFVWHPYYIDALAIRFYDDNTDGSSIADYYYLHDANYNVTAVANSSGAVVERYNYSPYGEVTVLDANFANDANGITDIGNTHFYTGRELDPETGLQLNRHRFYSSWLGRWLTRDPEGFADGTNMYEYTRSCPVGSVDPKGLITIIVAPKPQPVPPANQQPERDFAPDGCECGEMGMTSSARQCAKEKKCPFGEIWDVPDLNKQLKELTPKKDCIDNLIIVGHGSSQGPLTGSRGGTNCRIVRENVNDAFKEVPFCKTCTIEIRSCYGGQNCELMRSIARTTGCRVMANPGLCHVGSTGLPEPKEEPWMYFDGGTLCPDDFVGAYLLFN